jgi:hypothetical protein
MHRHGKASFRPFLSYNILVQKFLNLAGFGNFVKKSIRPFNTTALLPNDVVTLINAFRADKDASGTFYKRINLPLGPSAKTASVSFIGIMA